MVFGYKKNFLLKLPTLIRIKLFVMNKFLFLIRNFRIRRNEDAFTLVELIVVVVIIGILSGIAIPSFQNASVKARQKEAAVLINSYMKAVQSYYMEFGTYPRGAYSISEYVSVNACRVPDPSRCKNMSTYTPSGNSWFTPSGFYQIFFRGGYGYRTQILAAPTGSFASTGLPVVGCFNSQTNIMEIKLLTIKNISTSQMFC